PARAPGAPGQDDVVGRRLKDRRLLRAQADLTSCQARSSFERFGAHDCRCDPLVRAFGSPSLRLSASALSVMSAGVTSAFDVPYANALVICAHACLLMNDSTYLCAW